MPAVVAVATHTLIALFGVSMQLLDLVTALALAVGILAHSRVLQEHHCAAQSVSTHAPLLLCERLLEVVVHCWTLHTWPASHRMNTNARSSRQRQEAQLDQGTDS